MARQAKRQPKQWARDEEKEKFWRDHVEQWRHSGLSVSEFCRQQAISVGSFRTWRRELSIRDRETSGAGTARSVTPSLPDTVKDSKGRVIPTRFKKFCQTSNQGQPSITDCSFVPLTVVEKKRTAEPVQAEQPISLEIKAPSGFVFKLSCQPDVTFLSSLLKCTEVSN